MSAYGGPERRSDGNVGERIDRLGLVVKVSVALVLTVIVVSAVFSTVAVIGAGDAKSAASAAEDAAHAAERASKRAAKAIRRTERNAAKLEDLCQVARRQRRTLVLSYENSLDYLDSPTGREPGGLNDYIRAFSLPQLKARIAVEKLPPTCRKRS